MTPTHLHYPYRIDARGRTAEAEEDAWIRGLIEQVLFTSPGERVMRPDFGSGVLQMVFAPASDELAATTQLLVQAALQQHLGRLITTQQVEVDAEDATLRVRIQYVLLRDGSTRVAEFTRPGGTP